MQNDVVTFSPEAVLFKLGHIEGTLESVSKTLIEIKNEMAADRLDVKQELEKVKLRVTFLEKAQWVFAGGASVVTFLIIQLKDYWFPHV